MKILICPDKFKESLSAQQVADHIQNGILKYRPKTECKIIPLADGGEGTAKALTDATGGRIIKVKVSDPLMRPVDAFIGISGSGTTAFIEMSAASGLALLASVERKPLITSSFGTGELIKKALDEGCREIIIGIGGSATVDGGVGMAQALGIRFTDGSGKEISPGGGSLSAVFNIDLSGRDPRTMESKISVACDVTNKLTGESGAAYVFGPQKGADTEEVKVLDEGLRHLSQIIRSKLNKDVSQLPGGGAAGGLGAGIAAFLNGELKKGFHLVAETVQLNKWISWADIIITAEGKMDLQTTFGKVPAGVAGLAVKYRKNVIAFTGWLESHENLKAAGLNLVIPIADKPMATEQSMKDAGRLLENAAERTMRLIELGSAFQSAKSAKASKSSKSAKSSKSSKSLKSLKSPLISSSQEQENVIKQHCK